MTICDLKLSTELVSVGVKVIVKFNSHQTTERVVTEKVNSLLYAHSIFVLGITNYDVVNAFTY